MSAQTTTADRVRQIIAEQIGRGVEFIEPERSLFTDLGFDSLDCIEVVMAIEDEFDVELDDHEIEACETVGDFIAIAERLTAEAA